MNATGCDVVLGDFGVAGVDIRAVAWAFVFLPPPHFKLP